MVGVDGTAEGEHQRNAVILQPAVEREISRVIKPQGIAETGLNGDTAAWAVHQDAADFLQALLGTQRIIERERNQPSGPLLCQVTQFLVVHKGSGGLPSGDNSLFDPGLVHLLYQQLNGALPDRRSELTAQSGEKLIGGSRLSHNRYPPYRGRMRKSMISMKSPFMTRREYNPTYSNGRSKVHTAAVVAQISG